MSEQQHGQRQRDQRGGNGSQNDAKLCKLGACCGPSGYVGTMRSKGDADTCKLDVIMALAQSEQYVDARAAEYDPAAQGWHWVAPVASLYVPDGQGCSG